MKIAITGASGRMGRMLIEAVLAAPDMELAAALDRSDSPALGTDAGAFMGAKTGVTSPTALTKPWPAVRC